MANYEAFGHHLNDIVRGAVKMVASSTEWTLNDFVLIAPVVIDDGLHLGARVTAEGLFGPNQR